MRIMLGLASALVLAAGCSKPEPPPTAAASPYNTAIPMDEVMVHVINSAAGQFWSGWGVVDDETGSHDLTPKTDAEWEVLENGAATVVTATNAIMAPGYARAPEAEWNRLAQDVIQVALRGKEAAEKHDKTSLGDIGEQLDVACDACHAKFAISGQP
jgi:hypothetical protein